MSLKRFGKVYIEISNVCNLQCDFCPEVHREKKFMSKELFEKIIREVGPLTDSVCLHLMGEPLVHRQLEEFLKICDENGVKVNLTSNGVLIDAKRTETLMSPAIQQINFSLQSFENNFKGKGLFEYLEKLFDFTKRFRTNKPDAYINFRLWNELDAGSGIEINRHILEKIADCFNWAIPEKIDVGWKKGVRVAEKVYVHFDSRFRWPTSTDPVRSEKGFCYGLKNHFGILVDGTVVPCCLDKEGVIELGNCTSNSLESALTSKRATNMADGFAMFQIKEDLCQKCTFISRFDKKLPVATAQSKKSRHWQPAPESDELNFDARR